MPFAGQEGRKVYWKLEGSEGALPIVLLNSIGTDMDVWAPLLPALRKSHQLLRVDTLGHGASDAPGGDYSLTELANDVFAAMDAAGIASAAVAGLSLGGMIAMEMALARPLRVAALALVCTSATMDTAVWHDRVKTVRVDGMTKVAGLAMGRFLSPDFVAAKIEVADTISRQLVGMDPAGYAGCAAAIRDMKIAARLPNIACPTLVIVGDRDISTPFEGHGDYLLANIPNAHHCVLPAAHLATIEAPELLAAQILAFIADLPAASAIPQ